MERDATPAGALTITAVERLRKEKHRYGVYVDHEETPVLTVHEDILIRHRLLKGAAITADDIRRIKREDDSYRAYALAVAYLGAKPRTRAEIERYLRRKQIEPDTIGETADRLERERYIDDADYAERFARQRANVYYKGRNLIRQELMQRGISKETARRALAALESADELAAAVAAAEKKWRQLKGEPRERRNKLALFLLRRGYTGSIVKEALNRTTRTDGDELDADWLDN